MPSFGGQLVAVFHASNGEMQYYSGRYFLHKREIIENGHPASCILHTDTCELA